MTENSLWKQYWRKQFWPETNSLVLLILKISSTITWLFRSWTLPWIFDCTHTLEHLVSKGGNYLCSQVLMGVKSRFINSLWIPAPDRHQTILNTYSLSGQIWKILMNASIYGELKVNWPSKRKGCTRNQRDLKTELDSLMRHDVFCSNRTNLMKHKNFTWSSINQTCYCKSVR